MFTEKDCQDITGISDNLVSSPSHYTQGNIECIDAIQSALTEEEFAGYLRGNVVKYIWRCRNKGKLVDLQKCEWYLQKLISFIKTNCNE